MLCDCRGYLSTEMRHGRSVVVRDKRSVELGTENGVGTSLFVQEGPNHVAFDDKRLSTQAPAGTFQIRCGTGFGANNQYAVGIGRKIAIGNDEEIWPIILVRCVPNATFTFPLIQRFYVAYAPITENFPRFNPGTIIEPSEATRAEAELDGSGTAIKIDDDNNGNFWVNEKLCTPHGTANKPIRRENPTPSHSAAQASYPPPPGPSAPSNNPSASAQRDNQNPSGPVPFHVKRFPDLHKPADGEDDDSLEEDGLDVSRLDEWDVVFVVDDTGTMRLPAEGSPTKIPKDFTGKTRWNLVCEALEYLADVTAQRENDGIDIYFLLNKTLNKRKVKDGQSVLNRLQRVDLMKKGSTRFEPTLNPILREYMDRLRRAGNDSVRPLDVIVLTDGDAQDKIATNKLIQRTAKELDSLGVPENQVGIQFVQVGEDKKAATWLKNVYEHKDKETRNVRSTYSDCLPSLRMQVGHCVCCVC
jgi:hypothetical protein